jgi:hypothetical protein
MGSAGRGVRFDKWPPRRQPLPPLPGSTGSSSASPAASPSTGTLAVMQAPLAGATPAELEYGPVARAQLPDVAGYSSSYLVAGALGLNV